MFEKFLKIIRKYRLIPALWLMILISGVFYGLLSAQTSEAGRKNAEPVVGQQHAYRPGNAIIVPDRFLRRWDPVTLFFESDAGIVGGGPEDTPEEYVTMTPLHPGAYTWLDARTLQFRPAEPWPPLTSFNWHIGTRDVGLFTLMSSPSYTTPENGENDLEPVKSITLTFPEPVDPEVLAKMVMIELRPLPGIDDDKSRWLDKDDFEVKIFERSSRSDQATYMLNLNHPIGAGLVAIVHLRLSVFDSVEDAFARIKFSTAMPFYVTRFGCYGVDYPITPDGVAYTREMAIEGWVNDRKIQVMFSSSPEDLDPVTARNLVRFSPNVKNLKFLMSDKILTITGDFKADTLYKASLEPVSLFDKKGRSLQMNGPSHLFFYFPPQNPFLEQNVGFGISELYGPKMLPMSGRGHGRLDVRINLVNHLDRSFWPFPEYPIIVDENFRPPGPGEEPEPFDDPYRHIQPDQIAAHIKALGSPAVSTIVELPLRDRAGSANFGLDLAPLFEKMGRKEIPGTYLIGTRKLDESTERSWVRLQVTDLCLTTVEESHKVKFYVTSLSTGNPIEDAMVIIEGQKDKNKNWEIVFSGATDLDGTCTFDSTGAGKWDNSYTIQRIRVKNGEDSLVLNPVDPPDRFFQNHWSPKRDRWLQWTQNYYAPDRRKPPKHMCHIFTERPIYKPKEPVHIKGYFRQFSDGKLAPVSGKGFIVIRGPGSLEWRYPVEIGEMGSFYHLFNEDKLPTGWYNVRLEYKKSTFGYMEFQKEAYRLPRFEVMLHGPVAARLDQPFKVKMTASYYAGGRVADRPARWRVTQFPYNWTPSKLKGFFYSTDARFSGSGGFRAAPDRTVESRTDEYGGGFIEIDPGIEPTAQPRRYVVECTVTGADDQTVTNTTSVPTLPPFTLGLKVPRYMDKAENINSEIIVAGPDGKLIENQPFKLRLKQRQWHSWLQAGDFSDYSPKYVTDVVDEILYEKDLVSTKTPLSIDLPIDSAGVYIVEIEAGDRLGRTQRVSVDLFAGGKEPVTWSRPPSRVFKVTTEKAKYDPGEKAVIILESPFQKARVLAVVERPDGENQYHWIDIENGKGIFKLDIEKSFMPRIPVHFLLMRGRISNGTDDSGRAGQADLKKPITLASTCKVEVTPSSHKIYMELEYPKQALPGATIDLTINLKDETGMPLPGEVTLWLVDQAVLALAKEQRLDPLPAFIFEQYPYVSFRDTRNLALGYFPFKEMPGGDEGAEANDLLDKVTIRKNFNPVPYYEPSLWVDGSLTVKIKLSDNLTNFKIRAKAISGDDRFGYAKGHLAVRLPVIVQPSLPRFVRPGDSFTAMATGRIVEGGAGPGIAEIRVEGLHLEEDPKKEFIWDAKKPRIIGYSLKTPTPVYDRNGNIKTESVTITIGVERKSDKARDAFSTELPIRADRTPFVKQQIADLKPGSSFDLPAITEEYRLGTFRRTILVSTQPALIRMAAGLDYLMAFPHGCTEQRISKSRTQIAARKFRDLLYFEEPDDRIEHDVMQTMQWIESAEDSRSLVAFWPGSKGSVILTAWTVQFMVEAKAAGFPVNTTLLKRFIRSLKWSLRSDYKYYINGESWSERCWSLTALADAGYPDYGYAAELARKANYLNLESTAQVIATLAKSKSDSQAMIDSLKPSIWKRMVFRMYQGSEIYGGLQKTALSKSALVLPSETRTLAEVIRAMSRYPDKSEKDRFQLLTDALVNLGKGDGWGSTNANASALLALAEFISSSKGDKKERKERNVEITSETYRQVLELTDKKQVQQFGTDSTKAHKIIVPESSDENPLIARIRTRYIAKADGSHVSADSAGFVISREMLKIEPDGAPPVRHRLDRSSMQIKFKVGDVIEEHIELINPDNRHYVAVAVPLAAGMESLNPSLATAPPEAAPTGTTTRKPDYAAFMDDQMAFYYNSLPKGTYHFYFRTKATVPGTYIQPAAYSEMMYQQAVRGNGNGAKIIIGAEDGK